MFSILSAVCSLDECTLTAGSKDRTPSTTHARARALASLEVAVGALCALDARMPTSPPTHHPSHRYTITQQQKQPAKMANPLGGWHLLVNIFLPIPLVRLCWRARACDTLLLAAVCRVAGPAPPQHI